MATTPAPSQDNSADAADAPTSSGRSATLPQLRAVADATRAQYKAQLEAARLLVSAAQAARGRRELSILGEAGERLAQAALALNHT